MPLTYPVPADAKWTVYDVANQKPIAHGVNWPRADLGQLDGDTGEYIYLREITDPRPSVEQLVFILVKNGPALDLVEQTAHWTYTVQRRPNDEIVTAIANLEAEAVRALSTEASDELNRLQLLIIGLIEASKGVTLPPKAKSLADEFAATAAARWQARDRRKALEAKVAAGEDLTDIRDGWSA